VQQATASGADATGCHPRPGAVLPQHPHSLLAPMHSHRGGAHLHLQRHRGRHTRSSEAQGGCRGGRGAWVGNHRRPQPLLLLLLPAHNAVCRQLR